MTPRPVQQNQQNPTLTRLSELFAEASTLLAELAQQPEPTAPKPTMNDAVRIADACVMKGWTYSWAVKHWRKLGGYRDADGRLKIRADVLMRAPVETS